MNRKNDADIKIAEYTDSDVNNDVAVRCVIIGGADIRNYAAIRNCLREDDFYIFCDSGLKHQETLGVRPDLIVGDFDSWEKPILHPDAGTKPAGTPAKESLADVTSSTETIVLPCEKDDTDTVYAVKEALRRGFGAFLLLGVVGARLDHTLGNVSILLMLDSLNKPAKIIDDYSEMQIISKSPAFIEDSYAYFSLLNISGTAKGVTIQNAKYPLAHNEITCEYQYGISNEVRPGQTAKVTVEEGRLLLIKIFYTA